jgi:hypothetical protein
MAYMVAFTINIPQMLAYIAYMDPMGNGVVNQIIRLLDHNHVINLMEL